MRRAASFAGLVVVALAACGGPIDRLLGPARTPSPAPTKAERTDNVPAHPTCAVIPAPASCTIFGSLPVKVPPRKDHPWTKMPGWAPERYELVVSREQETVTISAGSDEGAFRAETTLTQLLMSSGGTEAPEVTIRDAPAYAWRGLMLDVARHFFPVPTIEAVIDRMALYKLNVLHLHLSDDQGFRLQLGKHPELANVGAPGGSYTKADIERLVAYAKEKFVTIVPEIDLPGHTRAILASHPELSCTGVAQPVPPTFGIFDDVLCAGNDATFALVSDVIDEVAALFPAPYMHVGGDELPPHRWSECPKCRARVAKEKLVGAPDLQPWFSRQVTAMVKRAGKTPIGWDEMLSPGLPIDTVIMAWRNADTGHEAGAAGHPVILAPLQSCYLNTPQPGQPLRDFDRPLSWEPLVRFELRPQPKLLGAEAALWTEHVADLGQIDTQLFPRLPALAERFWLPSRHPTAVAAEADFALRMRAQLPALAARGVGFYVEPPRGLSERTVFLRGAELVLSVPAIYDASIEVRLGDGAPFVYTHPIAIDRTTRVRATTILRDGRRSAETVGTFVQEGLRRGRPLPQTKDATPVSFAVYEGSFDRMPDFTQLVATRTSVSVGFDLPAGGSSVRATDYAVSFASNFLAPVDGIYTFFVSSDDGAVLWVDGERVVDNDGLHAPRERRGQIALAKGAHPVALGFFQGKGGAALRVDVSGPSLERRALQGPLLLGLLGR